MCEDHCHHSHAVELKYIAIGRRPITYPLTLFTSTAVPGWFHMRPTYMEQSQSPFSLCSRSPDADALHDIVDPHPVSVALKIAV